MESPPRKLDRELVILASLVVVMVVVSIWSTGRLGAARSHAAREGDSLSRCNAYANEIRALREEPSKADAHAMNKTDMTRHIAIAVSAVSMSEKKLVSIDHQSARRVGRTPYLEKPTRITLHDVELPQVLAWLYTLTQDNPRLSVSRLRLVAPRDESNTKAWNADTTVTYLIYEPVENDQS